MMRLNNLFSFMVPKNNLFFDLFAEDTANLVVQAKRFHELFSAKSPEEIQAIIEEFVYLKTRVTKSHTRFF